MTASPSSSVEIAGVTDLIGTLRDRVRALESEVVNTNAELAFRSDIEALVAHEIRTPLTVLRGALDTLQSVHLDPVEAKELIAAAARHARRACKTVDDLLEAGLRSRTVERAALEPVVFGEIVLEAVAALEDVADPVEVTVNGAEITFMTSPERLRAILVNLLSNATKAAPRGTIECDARMRGGGVRVEVRDRGFGIREPRLRFERPAGNDDPRAHGLFVVGMLAESLGGKSGIGPRLGGGAVAWCELPLRRHDDRQLGGGS